MAEDKKGCLKCPEGMVEKDGKCVLPEVTFSTFVMSLNTSALFHLGELEDPVTRKRSKDLVLAKHAIDTLKLLQNKTKGNLDEDEKALLDNILCDLKLRYVRSS